MTAPLILLRFVDQISPYGVIVDVTGQLKQIAVSINQNGFIPTLKQMADPFLLFVDVTGVTKTDILDYLGKRDISYLNNQMQMIGHQAECLDTVTEPFHTFLEQKIKPGTVRFGIKNILTAVATKDYMIKSTRIMDAGFASHVRQI